MGNLVYFLIVIYTEQEHIKQWNNIDQGEYYV